MQAAVASPLPFVDEHAVDIAAPPAVADAALARVLPRAFGTRQARLLAGLVGALERRPDPAFPALGSTLPGFRVAAREPAALLGLEGRHRFAAYALTFRIEALPGDRCSVRAETRALFPGLRGRAYRAAVIGSGMHVRVTRGLLEAAKRAAERPRE